MGIKGLGKFLAEISNHWSDKSSRSMLQWSLYQFMIAIRDSENFGTLTNKEGESTSHISGFLYRILRFLEHGIKPVYVFDGEPLKLKSGELAKRSERRAKAELELTAAKEAGDREEIRKFMGRTVRINKKHNDDIKELLTLIGIPFVEAPTEAEAQCAALAKQGARPDNCQPLTFSGVVQATATEDADALTFGSPILIRNLTVSDQKAKLLLTFDLATILKELDISMDQFIDFCILCGCDYCDRVKGIGPQTAFKLIKKHGCIESILSTLNASAIPENFNFAEARNFFKNPDVLPADEISKFQWKDLQEDRLKTFLIDHHGFNSVRVESYINR